MKDKYPFYFEVTLDMDGSIVKEGGFAYAADWDEAANVLKDAYRDELLSMTIEMFDSYEFFFPIEKARKIKEAMGL